MVCMNVVMFGEWGSGSTGDFLVMWVGRELGKEDIDKNSMEERGRKGVGGGSRYLSYIYYPTWWGSGEKAEVSLVLTNLNRVVCRIRLFDNLNDI